MQYFKKLKKKEEEIAAGKFQPVAPTALADRPSVLAARDYSGFDEGKVVVPIRTAVSEELPLSFTTYHWPYILHRDERFRFHQRKVVLNVRCISSCYLLCV